MTRRDLLRSAASLLAAGAALPPVLRPQSLLRMTPAGSEQFLPCHLGYLPGARKLLLFRASAPQRQVLVHVLRNSECVATHSVKSASFDFGPLAVLDLSSIARPARYQLTAGNQETSVQFNIDPEIWPKTLPVITGYHRYQRCGAAIPGVRPACHLDDGRRRDTGTHVDAVGGWHDAGDTRKWTDATLMNLFGLLAILRGRGNAVDNRNDPEFKRLLGEVRHGNAFFLKMQDADGLVWADVAGGVNGDNSDNRWTDNRPRTADDRWINTQKRTDVQAMFVAAESICAQVFQTIDPVYAQACLQAARRCWNASERSYNRTTDLAWWILAAVEFFAAAPDNSIYQAIIQLANQLRRFQFTRFEGNQDFVRGFFPMWPGNGEPLRDPVHSALPAYALLRAGMALPRNPEARTWIGATRLYIDGYVKPITSRSGYRIVPFGLFTKDLASDRARPVAGSYTFRYFMPVSGGGSWAGLNAHLLSHALLFAEAARFFREPQYSDLAYAQLEWVFGANPFSASLVTGLGQRNPPPFSRFAGPIPGGIMNGIAGNENDEPILDQQNSSTWQTNEYWSTQVGYCEWALSVLAKA